MAKRGEGKGKTRDMAKPARAFPRKGAAAPAAAVDDGGIPAFLRRRRDNTPDPRARPPASAARPQRRTEPTLEERTRAILEEMPKDQRAYFEKQIAEKNFLSHWLLDPTTVQMALIVRNEKQVKKEEGLARLRAMTEAKRAAEPPRPPRPTFGNGIKFKVLKEGARKPGTRGAKVYDAMVAWKKKNPNGTVAELLAASAETGGYNKTDLAWDVERGHIKTDV